MESCVYLVVEMWQFKSQNFNFSLSLCSLQKHMYLENSNPSLGEVILKFPSNRSNSTINDIHCLIRYRIFLVELPLTFSPGKYEIWAKEITVTVFKGRVTIHKAIFKYKNHPRIISIKRVRHQVSNFNFSCIDENTVLKEIRGLSTTKASQDNDLPVKILKENADY